MLFAAAPAGPGHTEAALAALGLGRAENRPRRSGTGRYRRRAAPGCGHGPHRRGGARGPLGAEQPPRNGGRRMARSNREAL